MVKYLGEIPLLLGFIGIILMAIYFEGSIEKTVIFGAPFLFIIVILIPISVIKVIKSCTFGHDWESQGHELHCKKCTAILYPEDDD